MTIKIAFYATYKNYEQSFLPLFINTLSDSIQYVSPEECDLLIHGPFFSNFKKYRWLPRGLRSFVDLPAWGRRSKPLILFHSSENVRFDYEKFDYGIGFDFIFGNKNYLRFPYWMEMIDWSFDGFHGNINPRYGELIKVEKLMRPINKLDWLSRKRAVAFFTSHMREPRMSIYNKVKDILPVDGYGPFFDPLIKDHNLSGYQKKDILNEYQFNLCPENNFYPGYYTEKIPEAYHSGCIPITCVDSNVVSDFNSEAFINLYDGLSSGYTSLRSLLFDNEFIDKTLSQPLIKNRPQLDSLRDFLRNILADVKN